MSKPKRPKLSATDRAVLKQDWHAKALRVVGGALPKGTWFILIAGNDDGPRMGGNVADPTNIPAILREMAQMATVQLQARELAKIPKRES